MTKSSHVEPISNAGDCARCYRTNRCLGWGLSGTEMPQFDWIKAKPRLLQRDDTLFENGERFTNVYVMRSGAVKTYKSTANDEHQIIDFHLPGDLLGLAGVATGHHNCHAIALDTTNVCAVSYSELLGLCDRFPHVQRHLLNRLSAAMVRNERFAVNMRTRDATARVAGFLLTLSEYHGDKGLSATHFTLPISRTDIASYLNLAVATVSRACTRFRREGIGSFGRNVAIQNLDMLRKAAGRTPLPAHVNVSLQNSRIV